MVYVFILMCVEGYFFVFYGDYYGIKGNSNYEILVLKDKIDLILMVWKNFVYGM